MACRTHCLREGLVMRAVGDRMIIAPPLVTTPAQVDEIVALVRRCLDLTMSEAHRAGWLA
jgi:putrescine aminotransferase